MKNLIIPCLPLLLISLLVSCKEESIKTSNKIDLKRTATLTGIVYANLDLTSSTEKTVPAGTPLKFLIDSKEFATVVVEGYVYQQLAYTTTVGSDGSYTIQLPALTKPISVQIVGSDFRATVKLTATTSSSTPKTFNLALVTVSINEGLTTIQDLQYQ